jgi:hypothetical protein
MSPTNPTDPASQAHPTGERRAEKERIMAAVWPPGESVEERAARAARYLAEFDALPPWQFPIELDDATWKWLAESESVYDEGE